MSNDTLTRLAYLICTSPRTGSTLLCRGLANTGRAGNPAEFFDHRERVITYWMRRLNIATMAEFADQVVKATSTANGVFGAKVHWTTVPDLHRALSATLCVPPDADRVRPLHEVMEAKFSKVRFIWLRRLNKVAQGISHYRAGCSDRWEVSTDGPRETSRGDDSVRFDIRLIDHCVNSCSDYDRQWEMYFLRHRLTPLQLTYEGFVGSYDRTLREVLDFLGIPHADLPRAEPQSRKMADDKSLDWEEKYKEYKAVAAGGLRRQPL